MKIEIARILVVDDEPVMLKYVTDSLRRLGIQAIETCSDGKNALQTMASFKPDLVLTDIHMKPMGGLEFVRLLRSASNAAMANTKVIFMSADASTAPRSERLHCQTPAFGNLEGQTGIGPELIACFKS